METHSTAPAHPVQKDSGRHSCLIAALIILAVMIVLGGGLIGLTTLFKDSNDLSFGEGVAVIKIEGIITDSTKTISTLSRIRRNEKIKAVIIRIDSPGGGVAATQEIYKEIERTKKKKKIVVSMGSVAASGGLYIAAPADKIIANPATVTGSIGVIMQMVNVQELLGKVGLSPVVIKSGKYKDIGSASRPMTIDERALLQDVTDQLHQQFVRDLAKGRGMDEAKVAQLADGRIFTGENALKLGLIDKLGNFEDAVSLAADLAGLEGRPNLIYQREEKSWWRELIGGNTSLQILPQWSRQPLTFQYLYLPQL